MELLPLCSLPGSFVLAPLDKVKSEEGERVTQSETALTALQVGVVTECTCNRR